MRRSPFQSFKNMRGFTLLESVIVLGVFAVMIAGIWMLVSTLYERAREHNANIEIQTIVGNIRQLYSRVSVMTTSPATPYELTLDQQNVFPTEMKANPGVIDGKLNHPWASVTSSTGGTMVNFWGGLPDANGDKTLMDMQFNSLPKKACAFLAMQIPNGIVSGITYIKINSGSCYGSDPTCAGPLPIDLTTATAKCSSGTNALGRGTNSVLFRFSIH